MFEAIESRWAERTYRSRCAAYAIRRRERQRFIAYAGACATRATERLHMQGATLFAQRTIFLRRNSLAATSFFLRM
jgi:hypothetical protein